MTYEELKLKISVAISSTNTSGNQKLETIMWAVDDYLYQIMNKPIDPTEHENQK